MTPDKLSCLVMSRTMLVMAALTTIFSSGMFIKMDALQRIECKIGALILLLISIRLKP